MLKENARDTKVVDVFAAVLCEIITTKCGEEEMSTENRRKKILRTPNANAHEKEKLCLFVVDSIEKKN